MGLLNKKSLSVMVGTTYQLIVIGTTKNISWKSIDSSVTTVTKNGTVKGIMISTGLLSHILHLLKEGRNKIQNGIR